MNKTNKNKVNYLSNRHDFFSVVLTAVAAFPVCLVVLVLALPMTSSAQGGADLFRVESIRPLDTAGILKEIRDARSAIPANPDSAFALLYATGRRSREEGYPYGSGLSLFGQALAQIEQGRYGEAEKKLSLSVTYFMRSPEGKKHLPWVVTTQGNVYYWMGNYDQALKHFHKAIALSEQLQINPDYIYNQTAAILIQMSRSRESVWPYLDLAEKSALLNENYIVLCNVYCNKGIVYLREKMWDSSLYYFNKSVAVAEKNDFPAGKHLALTNIGVLNLDRKMPAKALSYLLEAKKIEQFADKNNKNFSMSSLGNAYIQLHQYAKAEAILLEQYHDALAMGQKGNIREAHFNLSTLYNATKNYQKAYEHAWGYITLNNSIAGDEINNKVNQHELAFQSIEKDKKIVEGQLLVAQRDKDLERKNKWITLIAASVIIAGLIVAFIGKSYLARQRIMQHQLNNLEKQRKIDHLQATIDGEEKERKRIAGELHDGIGGLISAAKMNMGYLEQGNLDPDQKEIFESTAQILNEAGMELRMTAHNMMPGIFLQHDLIEAINSFCKYIQKSKKLAIDIQAYGNFELLSDHYRLGIYRIIQELIHNVAKHSKATEALVQIIYDAPVLSVTVEDDGIGLGQDKPVFQQGVGLESVHARVESLGGTCNIETAEGKGTSFYIEFDIQ